MATGYFETRLPPPFLKSHNLALAVIGFFLGITLVVRIVSLGPA